MPTNEAIDDVPLSTSEAYGQATFIHSSFRTSSTWIWNAFRALDVTRSYYEIFHDDLASLRAADIPNQRYDTWNSKHPVSKPYFEEFSGLCAVEGGVRNYRPEMAFKSFVPADGLDGRLNADEVQYIADLIVDALQANRKPVLTCCRSLGRIAAIKREFGGWNIFAYRNIFYQWMSYLSQYHSGNPYFIETVARTLEFNRHDAFLSKLHAECRGKSSDDFCGFHDIGNAFKAFVGLHLYLSMKAFSDADQVIEVDRLADDQIYVGTTQLTILCATGLKIDFSDAQRNIESVSDRTYVPDELQDLVLGTHKAAAGSLGYKAGSPQFDFGLKLATEILSAERDYRIYTRSMRRQLLDCLASKRMMEAELERLKVEVSEAKHDRQRLCNLQAILKPATKTMTWRLLKHFHPAWPQSIKQHLS